MRIINLTNENTWQRTHCNTNNKQKNVTTRYCFFIYVIYLKKYRKNNLCVNFAIYFVLVNNNFFRNVIPLVHKGRIRLMRKKENSENIALLYRTAFNYILVLYL